MKKEIKAIIFSVAALSFLSCGGGREITPTRLVKPQWIASSDSSVMIRDYFTRVVYVSNFIGGDVFPIDVEKGRTIDTDLFNDGLTPVAVARGLGQIMVRDSQDPDYSLEIFVASKIEKALYLIKADAQGDSDKHFLGHRLAEIGDTKVCSYSKPYFEDKGNSSNPSMGDITVDEDKGITQNWSAKYWGSGKAYRVLGSVSGLQESLAKEDEPYTSDDGSLKFTIYSGSRDTTNGDNFTFGTTCTKPLLFAGVPQTFIFADEKLFVGLEDINSVEIFEGSDFSHIESVPLDDSSGTPFTPTMMLEYGEYIYITNLTGTTITALKKSDHSVSYHEAGESTSYAAKIDGIEGKIYLLPTETNRVAVFSTVSNSVESYIELPEIPRSMTQISDGTNSQKRAFVTNITNRLYEVDMTNEKIVDRKPRPGTKSSAGRPTFFDVGPKSQPRLTGINTQDGLTKTESWMINYNGVISGTFSLAGEITDNNLTDAGADFISAGVIAGDMLIINPFEDNEEEFEILSVTDAQNLVLIGEPQTSGADIIYQIRSNGNYVVNGSLSGAQISRAYEGTPYYTDSDSMAFTVIGSLNYPTTKGDYFAFYTYDGLDLLLLKNKMLPLHMAATTRVSDAREQIYIANEGSNNLSIVDVRDMRETRTID